MTATIDIGAVTLAVAAVTDTGRKREVNEDSILAEAPAFLVADGMGGYEAGDRASAEVVAAFRDHVSGEGFGTLFDVRDALIAAEAAVAEVAKSTKRGAGSTVSGVVLVEHEGSPHWLVFNVGDSRVYRHLGSELDQLTVDHSLGQELVDAGTLKPEDLHGFEKRNVITRAIGAADSVADSWLVPVTNGERLLICSDGLTSEVADEGIRAILTMGGRPASVADALVRRANSSGGKDNISVVIVDVVSGGGALVGEFTTGAQAMYQDLLDPAADETTLPVQGR